jgi:hypothetical protein
MSALAFDTLKAAKALREAGFGEAQAEAVVATVSGAINDNLATKADLQNLATKAELQLVRADLHDLDQRMTAGFHDLDQRMTAGFRDLDQRMTAGETGLEQRMTAGFRDLEQRMTAGETGLEQRMTAGFRELEQRMTIKLGAMIAAAAGFVAVVQRLV